MTRRIKGGVLQAFCKFLEDTEVPPIYTLWTGVAIVSAVLGRDCFVECGYYALYPNLYIVLVGPPAKAKKSTPIRIATKIVKQVVPPINVLSQKMTPEYMISELSGLTGDDGGTQVVPSAIGIVLLREFSTLINKSAVRSGMLEVLTDLYDTDDFEYGTRAHGKEVVKNPCLSILGGSTPDFLKYIPSESIGMGFTSRILFIYSPGTDRMVPRLSMSAESRQMRDDVVHDLNEIAKMRGMFVFDEQAGTMYDKEYVNFRQHSPLIDTRELAGYAGRRADMLTKVSMIVSAAHSSSRVITTGDLATAIALLQKAEEGMPDVIRSITSKEVGDIFEQILKYMMRHKIVRKPELIKRFRHKMTSSELDIFMKSLEEERAIRIDIDGRDIRYTFVGKSK